MRDVRLTLAAQPNEGRPFEAALAVAPVHRACPPLGPDSPRSSCDGLAATPEVGALARRLDARLRESADASALHARALVDLVWGDTAGSALDSSISRLGAAARLADRPADVLADLAAAHLVRAARAQDARDLLEAMEAATRALDHDSTHWAARFDLALALDRLGLVGQAADAWTRAAAVAPDEAWAREAQRRGARARPLATAPVVPPDVAGAAALADTAPLRARTAGWTDALGAWGRATLAGDRATADRTLALAAALGAALARGGRDRTLEDAVAAIRAHAGDGAATRRLARGHAALALAQRRYDSLDNTGAALAAAEVRAADPPSPTLRAWSEVIHGGTLAYEGKNAAAERIFREVVATTDTTRHVALAARARWNHGIMLLRIGLTEAGRASLRAAERLYRRSGETELLGVVQAFVAEAELEYGADADGWASLHRALVTLRAHPWSERRHAALYLGVRYASREGWLGAAEVIQAEAVAVAERVGRPQYLAEALLSRSRVATRRGDAPAAGRDIARARTLIGGMGDARTREWFEAELAASFAAATMGTEPARAAASLDSAARFFASHNVLKELGALLARSEAALRLGDDATADARLGDALARLDAQRDSIADPVLRAALVASARAAVHAVVMRHVARRDTVGALAWLERARPSLAPTGVRRGAVATTRPRGPSGTVVLDYALVGDTLLAWTIAGDDVRLVRQAVPRSALDRTIERVRTALELGIDNAALRADLALLHGWLVAPVASRLGDEGTPLVVVAAGALGDVPFAALRRADGPYLVERHPIRFAGALADAAPGRARGRGGLVLVGEPARHDGHDRGVSLPPLPGAREEVRAVAREAGARGATVIEGEAARPSAVREALARAGTLHYAGHAVLDERRPERSWLALAAEPSGSDRLTAADLARLDLGGLELVVLSACQTLRARDEHAGAFAGFAGSLLAAGAGGVVGSLWRVDDAATRTLMVEFHRQRGRERDVARALRLAQLSLLRSGDARLASPAAWGAFRYAGR